MMMKESPARRFVTHLLLVVMIVFTGTVALSSAAVAISPTPEPPEIGYNPTSFSFTATEGDPSLSDTLWLRNDGDGTLTWSVSDDADWLSLDPPSGTSAGEMDEVSLLVNITGMSAGSYSATITIEAAGASNTPQTVPVSLTINPAPGPPEIWYNPTSFSFYATEGGANPVSQSLWLRNDGDGTLTWSVSDDADWLSLDPTTGSSAGEMDEVSLLVDIGGMSAGSYSATITIEAPGATNTPQTAPVSLTINPAPGPPEIWYNPTSFSFTATEGDPSLSDTLWLRNDGDGTLTWSVSDDADWLSLDPPSGTSAGEMDEVVLSVNIGGMGAGSYSATITIEAPGATNTPQTASVSLSINPPPGPPEIWYNPTSFSFTATEGDPNLSDTLWIRNDGDGTLDWTVGDDADWLTLNPPSGTSAGEMDEVVLSVDIGGMVAGSYSATITIEAAGASNSPQTASVSLTINPPPGPPEIWYNPTSFSFTATEGDPSLSDTLWIRNDGDGSLTWSVSDDADGVKDWLSLSPITGSSEGEMDELTLLVDISGMSAGSYSATITIEAPGATNSPQTASVSLTINPAAGPPAPTISCSPTSFSFTATEGGANPADQTLGIWNSGSGSLDWSVSDDADGVKDWLTLDPTSGSSTGETDEVTLSVDIGGMVAGSYSATIAGMSAGSYSATITIEAPGASNTPQTVPVSLIIESEPGGSTEPPCRFHGTVQVDGAYVPDGTLITASIAGAVLTWTTTTTSSSPESVYVLDVPGDDTLTLEKDGGVEDDVVSFTIRHGTTDLAAGSGVWHKGIPQEVNLQAATGGRSSGGGGGKSSPTEPTKPPEEPAEPAEPVVPEPEPTPTPPAPPPAPEEPSDEGGLAPGAWAGIGIGSALLLALVVWLILRRWVWAAADGEDS